MPYARDGSATISCVQRNGFRHAREETEQRNGGMTRKNGVYPEAARLEVGRGLRGRIHFLDAFGFLRPRSEDTCKLNNNHYLCTGGGPPVGDAGWWVMDQILLAFVCDD